MVDANRVAAVNRALRARGVRERLARGRDSFHFTGGTTYRWATSTVSVATADALTVAEWLQAYDTLSTEPAAWV
jgi:hypothetical protein